MQLILELTKITGDRASRRRRHDRIAVIQSSKEQMERMRVWSCLEYICDMMVKVLYIIMIKFHLNDSSLVPACITSAIASESLALCILILGLQHPPRSHCYVPVPIWNCYGQLAISVLRMQTHCSTLASGFKAGVSHPFCVCGPPRFMGHSTVGGTAVSPEREDGV